VSPRAQLVTTTNRLALDAHSTVRMAVARESYVRTVESKSSGGCMAGRAYNRCIAVARRRWLYELVLPLATAAAAAASSAVAGRTHQTTNDKSSRWRRPAHYRPDERWCEAHPGRDRRRSSAAPRRAAGEQSITKPLRVGARPADGRRGTSYSWQASCSYSSVHRRP